MSSVHTAGYHQHGVDGGGGGGGGAQKVNTDATPPHASTFQMANCISSTLSALTVRRMSFKLDSCRENTEMH